MLCNKFWEWLGSAQNSCLCRVGYNNKMTADEFHIRLCMSCGLRYPVEDGDLSRTRCPVCQGDTQLVAAYPLQAENWVPFKDPALHLEALLDNVRSALDVGSIFRTAHGLGLKHLYLCGITPTPEESDVQEVSLGAEKSIPWTYRKDSVMILQALKEQGYKAFALAHDESAISIKEIVHARRRRKSDSDESRTTTSKARKISPTDKVALVLGNEMTGVDPDLFHICDEVVYIPMRGNSRPSDVVTAFAVAVSQLVL